MPIAQPHDAEFFPYSDLWISLTPSLSLSVYYLRPPGLTAHDLTDFYGSAFLARDIYLWLAIWCYLQQSKANLLSFATLCKVKLEFSLFDFTQQFWYNCLSIYIVFIYIWCCVSICKYNSFSETKLHNL